MLLLNLQLPQQQQQQQQQQPSPLPQHRPQQQQLNQRPQLPRILVYWDELELSLTTVLVELSTVWRMLQIPLLRYVIYFSIP